MRTTKWKWLLDPIRLPACLITAAFLLGLGAAVFLQRGVPDVVYSGPGSRYATALKQTVLVEVPGGSGTGFVVIRENAKGEKRVFVWTAKHVIDGSDVVRVKLTHRNNGERAGVSLFDARAVYRSVTTDAALLQVVASPDWFETTEFDFSKPEIGAPTFHIGNLFGPTFDSSLTTGVISQVGVQSLSLWRLVDQTTSIVIPGSSGGPMFNARNGKVLGIVVGWPGLTGVSLYIPSRELARVVTFNWMLHDVVCPSDTDLDQFAIRARVPGIVPALPEGEVACPPPLTRP